MKRYASTAERPDPRTPVAVPSDVYEAMREVAKTEHRSITAQIVVALTEWLAARKAA